MESGTEPIRAQPIPTQSEEPHPVVAGITCIQCGAVHPVQVSPDFNDIKGDGPRITALTPEAEKAGYKVVRGADGNRAFYCARCSGSLPKDPAKFTEKMNCAKCGVDKPKITWCAGCSICSGEHLHYNCIACGYTWLTLTKDHRVEKNPRSGNVRKRRNQN